MRGGRGRVLDNDKWAWRKTYTQTECATVNVSAVTARRLGSGLGLGDTRSGPGLIIGVGNMSIWFV